VLDDPAALTVTSDGTVYLADAGNNRIRTISTGGTITTLAGDGRALDRGDGGPAVDAELDHPDGLAVGPDESLYVATSSSVRRIDRAGTITTLIEGSGPNGGGDGRG
jgi:sugar lactone lactonase YvrE